MARPSTEPYPEIMKAALRLGATRAGDESVAYREAEAGRLATVDTMDLALRQKIERDHALNLHGEQTHTRTPKPQTPRYATLSLHMREGKDETLPPTGRRKSSSQPTAKKCTKNTTTAQGTMVRRTILPYAGGDAEGGRS